MAKKSASSATAVRAKPLKPLLDGIEKALRVLKGTEHAAVRKLNELLREYRQDCHRCHVVKKPYEK